MRRLGIAAVGLVLLASAAGCGGTGRADAVEATEAHEVVVGGVSYRVDRFREINPYEEPRVRRGPPPPAGSALYAAFVEACAVGGEPARATGSIVLENAFGRRFEALAPKPADQVAYRPARLAPGACVPRPESIAARSFGGAPLVFRVPHEAVEERPLVLEIRDPDADEKARVVLDL